jgi:hypothetical protein
MWLDRYIASLCDGVMRLTYIYIALMLLVVC